jgi:Fe-S cluster assembly ATP-binding protein
MLVIDNLSVALSDKLVLEHITLSLKSGELHVLMGPNGSGKSTLAYVLMGHPAYTVTAGALYINNQNIVDLEVEKRARSGLFLIPQYPQEVPGVQVFTFLKEAHRMLTGQDIGVPLFKDLVYQAFDKVELDHSFAYRNVHAGFSGGEKKRLELAQLLLFNPTVAILDEIDSGLDVDALKLAAHAIRYAQAVNPAMTILLITHYTRILAYLEPAAVSVMHKGTIVASGDKQLAYQIDQKGYDGVLL